MQRKKILLRIIISSLVIGVTLFIWSGITQVFPWGVPTVNQLRSASDNTAKNFSGSEFKRVSPPTTLQHRNSIKRW